MLDSDRCRKSEDVRPALPLLGLHREQAQVWARGSVQQGDAGLQVSMANSCFFPPS